MVDTNTRYTNLYLGCFFMFLSIYECFLSYLFFQLIVFSFHSYSTKLPGIGTGGSQQ